MVLFHSEQDCELGNIQPIVCRGDSNRLKSPWETEGEKGESGQAENTGKAPSALG